MCVCRSAVIGDVYNNIISWLIKLNGCLPVFLVIIESSLKVKLGH